MQRLDDLAVRVEPFADLEDTIAREQDPRRRSKDIEHVLAPPLPSNLVDISKSFCGEQAGARALALEQRVERHGGPMQDQRYAVRPEFIGEILRDVLHHRGRLFRMGEVLAYADELACVLIES